MMVSISETRHDKNVANFNTAFQVIEAMGNLYNPSISSLLFTNLYTIKAALSGTIEIMNEKKELYENAVFDREMEIDLLGRLTVRALNYAKTLNISETDKENLLKQFKKIRGESKKRTINPDLPKPDPISISQISYDKKISNYLAFIMQLASHPEYQPNETAIQIESLQSLHVKLSTINSFVNATGNALLTARNYRNDILYFNDNNIMKLIKEIKSYLKSLGKRAVPYHRTIVRLRFNDIKR